MRVVIRKKVCCKVSRKLPSVGKISSREAVKRLGNVIKK